MATLGYLFLSNAPLQDLLWVADDISLVSYCMSLLQPKSSGIDLAFRKYDRAFSTDTHPHHVAHKDS